ncbi:DUF3108 domain-containing protein [soil metagenome]
MSLKNILLLLVLSVFTVSINAQTDTIAEKKVFRKIEQKAFNTGEKLTFDINYGFITAGSAVMSISPVIVMINGRPCYEISFTVNSSSGFSSVYEVKDYYKCYMDVEGLFPWKFEQHIREGNYQRDFEAIFDQENHTAKTYTGITDPKKFEGEFTIPEYVHDAISAFYFSRTLDYSQSKIGDVIHLQNFYKDETFPLDVKYLGKEDIEVSAGEFRCIKIQPSVKEGGLFKSEGDITVWLTDDERRMPVKVQSKIIIGSVDSDLTEYKGLAGPLNSKK